MQIIQQTMAKQKIVFAPYLIETLSLIPKLIFLEKQESRNFVLNDIRSKS